MTTTTLADLVEASKIRSQEAIEADHNGSDHYHPDLPREARLSDKLLAQGEKAGAWLRAYVDFANKASPMSAPEHHQILGLTLMATAIARRVKLCVSTDSIYPNLYSLIVGSSGDSKSGATRLASKILRQAKLNSLTLPSYMSPQGLLQELIGRKPDNTVFLEGEDLESLKTKLRFSAQRVLILDESEALFEWFGQQNMQGIKSLIRRLYDCPEEEGETLASRGVGIARNCYLTICGVSTPTDLAPFLKTSAHWANGIWARFIFVTANWEKPPYVFYPPALEIPAEIPDLLNRLAFSRLPIPQEGKPLESITVSLSPGVFDLWKLYDKATRYDMVFGELGNRYKSSYKRLPAMLMKAAILLASMDWAESKLPAPVIEKSHLAQAYVITEQWRASLHRLIEIPNKDGQEESLETKALRFIPSHASGLVITERDLAIKLNLSNSEERPKVSILIAQMRKDKLIIERSVKIAGADGKQYPRTGLCRGRDV